MVEQLPSRSPDVTEGLILDSVDSAHIARTGRTVGVAGTACPRQFGAQGSAVPLIHQQPPVRQPGWAVAGPQRQRLLVIAQGQRDIAQPLKKPGATLQK